MAPRPGFTTSAYSLALYSVALYDGAMTTEAQYKAMTLAELCAAWRDGDREGDLEEALRNTEPALCAAYTCWHAAEATEYALNTPEPFDAMVRVQTPVADRVREIYEAHLQALTGVPRR